MPEADLTLQPGHSQGPRIPALDLSRIQADTGWTPRVTLEAGIADYVAWLRAGNPQ